MTRSAIRAFALLALSSLLAMPASAQTSIDFDGAAAPCYFNEATPLTNQYSGLGVSFLGNGTILDQCSNFPVQTARSGANFLAYNTAISPVSESIRFASANTQFSIWFAASTGISLDFYSGQTWILNLTYSNVVATQWNPISLGIFGNTFDRVDITGNGDLLQLDDLSTDGGGVVTPEPASMTLLATGLAGMMAARRRKRQR